MQLSSATVVKGDAAVSDPDARNCPTSASTVAARVVTPTFQMADSPGVRI
jgi:hypothetical protein